MSRKSRIASGIILVVAACIGLWLFLYRGSSSLAASYIPATPDMTGWAAPWITQMKAIESAAEKGSIRDLGDLGLNYHANGFFQEASLVYEGMMRLDPSDPLWPYLYSDILSGFGKLEDAIELLTTTLGLDPTYPTARLRLAEGLQKLNRTDEAEAGFRKCLEDNPKDFHAMIGLARIHIDRKDWDSAEQMLRQATLIRPSLGAPFALLESVYTQSGKPGEAANARIAGTGKPAHEDPPDPWKDHLIDRCQDPYRLRVAAATPRYENDSLAAIALLERAISLAPQDASIHRQLGMLLFRNTQPQAALSHLRKSVKLDPVDPDGWAYLVHVLTESGQSIEAENQTVIGLSHCPEAPGLHLERARQRIASGDYTSAIRSLQTLIRLRPEESVGYVELARAYFASDRIDDGIAQMKKALEVEPGHPVAITTLALHAIESGDQAAARRLLLDAKAQLRVPPSDIQELTTAFSNQFGSQP